MIMLVSIAILCRIFLFFFNCCPIASDVTSIVSHNVWSGKPAISIFRSSIEAIYHYSCWLSYFLSSISMNFFSFAAIINHIPHWLERSAASVVVVVFAIISHTIGNASFHFLLDVAPNWLIAVFERILCEIVQRFLCGSQPHSSSSFLFLHPPA